MAQIRVQPVKQRRGLGWLVALLVVLVIAAGVVWWLYQNGTINLGGF
jgi:hypothetical protein